MRLPELPRAVWRRIAMRTGLVISIASLVSLLLAHFMLSTFSGGLNLEGALASVLMPFLIGGPTMFYHQIQAAQLREANRRLEVLAATDWLTGCLNRRAFTGEVTAALAADPLEGCGFLVIDADHFKTINDRFGHDRGDEVLQFIANALRDAIGDDDLVGRLGGEEFGVFLRGADADTTHIVAERMRRSINALCLRSGDALHRVSVSIGAAVGGGSESFSELFRLADQRLYRAKQAGRNRTELDDGPVIWAQASGQ
jgi:diguanylate cyclase